MMLAVQVAGRISHNFEEVFIGFENVSLWIEFNHCRRQTQRIHDTASLQCLRNGAGDINAVEDDTVDQSLFVAQRRIAALEPDRNSCFCHSSECAENTLTKCERLSKSSARLVSNMKVSFAHAHDLFDRAGQCTCELFIGVSDKTVDVDPCHRHGLVNGLCNDFPAGCIFRRGGDLILVFLH